VYEIGKNFRNEGLSKKHNPEFTMLEFYQAYATFEDLMNLTEELYVHLAKTITGGLKVPYGDHVIDFTPPWPRISMQESVHSIGGVDRSFDLSSGEGVRAAAARYGVGLEEPEDWGRSLEALWGELVEHKLINPTFITHHPFSISPLARKNLENGAITDRFELIVAGMEGANAFSELNDAEDQRERFEAQARRKAEGDEEATEVDEDFLRALEYGLPPTAGEGVGIDRLVMLLTNSPTIRDVLLFPQLKPRSGSDESEQQEEETA
jgi:lysyl-tRNA synthetase class 2